MTGPPARRRQRPRRRITPNTNTSTTTMISTHNHVDMAVSLVGAGRFAVTLLPPTRASNSVTARRLPGPGGCQPVSDHASARWGRALRAAPSQPSRNRIDQHHTSGGPGRRQPTQHDHGEPDGRGMARPSSVCPAWVGEQSKHGDAEAQWQTPRRRRRTDGARLWRNPNLRRGRLHRPALPVQPRSALRDPPRLGPAAGDSAAATLPLSCRDRWSARLGRLALLRASASKELPSR